MLLLAVGKTRTWLPFPVIALFFCALLASSHIATVTMPYDYTPASDLTGGFSIVSEGGRLLVVDHSDNTAQDVRLLEREAESRRCTEVEEWILTGYENRTAYTIEYLASAMRIRRIRISDPSDERERAILLRIREICERRGIELRFELYDVFTPVPREENVTFGDAYIGVPRAAVE